VIVYIYDDMVSLMLRYLEVEDYANDYYSRTSPR
jgi:hypothetical protein